MDSFNINQLCRICRQGNKVFEINLSCYDAEGKLTVNSMQLLRDFSFQCEFCNHVSTLDFDKFSHPSIIIQLKRQNEKIKQIKQQLKDFLSLLNE